MRSPRVENARKDYPLRRTTVKALHGVSLAVALADGRLDS